MESLNNEQKDDLLKKISDTVEKRLGLAEKIVIRAAVAFARKNYSKEEMDRELCSLIDTKTAKSLASEIDYTIKSFVYKYGKHDGPEELESRKTDRSRKRKVDMAGSTREIYSSLDNHAIGSDEPNGRSINSNSGNSKLKDGETKILNNDDRKKRRYDDNANNLNNNLVGQDANSRRYDDNTSRRYDDNTSRRYDDNTNSRRYDDNTNNRRYDDNTNNRRYDDNTNTSRKNGHNTKSGKNSIEYKNLDSGQDLSLHHDQSSDFKPKSTADAIRASLMSGPSMVDNLKKQIEEKKEQLRNAIALGRLDVVSNTSKLEQEMTSKSHKAALLQLQIQQKLAEQKGLNFDVSQLDSTAQTSKTVSKDGFRTSFAPKKDDITKSIHYDKRMKSGPPTRTKRFNLSFNEPGKYIQLADRIRAKEKLEVLQQKVQSAAKKTGIASAAKFALVTTKQNLQVDKIPKMEWWDNAILPYSSYNEFFTDLSANESNPDWTKEKLVGISNLIEHPVPKPPPDDPNDNAALPIYLTKAEQKKMRTQKRKLMEQEKQEKIRLGLMPPPPPKVKIANLMRVLGTEAVQDPTKVEAHVREQMMARQKKHEADNAARQLTDEQKRQKKIKKLKEDTSLGVYASVFRVWDLSNPLKRFKVDKNAQQFYMTGCILLLPDNMNLVIVESGPKAHKKFKHLMLNRIKWTDDSLAKSNLPEMDIIDIDYESFVPNKCQLVWSGVIKKRLFSDWKVKTLTTYSQAKEFLQSHSCDHYWDLVYTLSLDTDNASNIMQTKNF